MDITGAFQILGVVVSIIAFSYAREAKQKSLAFEEELAKIEKRRETDRIEGRNSAQIVPELVRIEPNKYLLTIENVGDSEARDVKVFADDKPIGEFFRYQDFSVVKRHIFERISSRNKLVLMASTNSSNPLPSEIHGSFVDDTDGGTFELYVSSRRSQ